MKLKNITVVGLFNRYNYNIDLEPQVTILHGLNGVGKSTVLRLTQATLTGESSLLRGTTFQEISITFDDGRAFHVRKTWANSPGDTEAGAQSISFSYSDSEGEHQFPLTERRQVPPSQIERQFPFLDRISPREWFDALSGESLDYDEVMARYGEAPSLPFKPTSPVLVDANRLQRMDLQENTHYPPSRRILPRDTVAIYSDELASMLRNKIMESAALSQDLDRTFPQRLITLMLNHNTAAIDPLQVQSQLEDLERKRHALETVGLLDKSQQSPLVSIENLEDDDTRRVLSLYIEDTKKKLAVFDETARKVDLFLNIIKNRQFLNKSMRLSREQGFMFTTGEGDDLRPSQLSSGEQHELIMTYELLFKADNQSLVLIDEPEISLHIRWQQEFLNDLLDVVALTDCQVIVATHSPDIIRENWEITRALGEE